MTAGTQARALKFGIFMAPFHPTTLDPTIALERDIELAVHADQIGLDECWFGEHHSGGMEIIGSPELMIAAAAHRTRRIMLGTGVVSLPYHHPLMLADRIVQLDHLCRGRLLFGVGAGALPPDVHMMGLDAQRLRPMMEEALEVLQRLLAGETVSVDRGWFKLQDARCQLLPYSRPYPEISVAATSSPAGPRLAGRLGVGVLSIAATTQAGFDALGGTWDVWSTMASANGNAVDRSSWRLAGPVHIAETREKARENVKHGLRDWLRYFKTVASLPVAASGEGNIEDDIDAMVSSGLAVIGTPDDLVEKIEALWDKSGGFGTWLDMAHDWADFENTKRSYELIAAYVKPRFNRTNDSRDASMNWAAENRDRFMSARQEAVKSAVASWEKERSTLSS